MTDPWGRMTDPSRGKSVKEGRAPINRYIFLNTIWVLVLKPTQPPSTWQDVAGIGRAALGGGWTEN